MSGSAGGSRIPREALQKTVDSYIKKVLKGFKGFKSAKISGSYNTTDKQDFGDIDLIVNVESDLDKKTIKQDLVKHFESLPEDIIVPFKSDKNKGKRSLNHGEIVTVLYPIEGMPGEFVQIDNIMSLSEEEGEFKKSVLDLPAEKQGLVLGLIKVVLLEEDPEKVFARMGIKNIDPLGPDEEYEFHVDTSGLTLKKVKLDKSGDKIRTVESTDVWKTSNFNDVKKLLSNFNIDGSFEDIVSDIKKLKNPRSKDRVKGWFLKNIRVQAGEIGTPKAEKKQYAIDTINALEGKYNSLVMSMIRPILAEVEEFSRTIALMPGAFKPPHKDHVKRINAAADAADKALILISPLERTQESQLPITAEQSLAIWNLYKEKGIIKDNVYFKISPDNSPVKTAYDTIIANPQNKYIGVYGKEDAARWKNIETKYPNATASDFGIVADLSASDLRTALLNDEDISSFLPDGITPEEYKQALGLNNTEYSSPEIIETYEDEIYEEAEPVIEYKTKESLNPEIWEEDKIKPELLEALLKIANKFYNDLNIYYPLEDILLIGSSANYNWTDLSDIDVHLLIDFSRVKDPQLFKDYVDSKKNEFNNKYDLKYKDHPVEVYVQDTNEPNASLGVYSLLNNEWIKHPDKENIEIPDSEIEQKAEPLMNQIDDLIKDKTTSSEDVRDLKKKIKRFRQSGLSSDGEYSLENLAFKKLRYDGYLEKLNYLEKHINIKNFGLEKINEETHDSIAQTLKKPLTSLTKYLASSININPLPKVKFINNDKENAKNILGKTAHYDPNDKSITLYTLDRHPKDILRSFSHEMIHHNQNLEDRLNNINTNNTNEDGDLPEIEREAYEKGNMFFRNWEDSIKNSTLNEILIKKPFEFNKLMDAYKKDEFYKKNITKNGTILFHLYTDDLIEKVFPDPEDQQRAKDFLESMYKEAGSNYVLLKDGRVIKPTVGLGHYADVIDSRWIKDRRTDYSEVLLDSENNFKEIIKSDPDSMIKSQGENVVACKVNGQYVFFNYLTETVLGEFDKYNAIWSPGGSRNDQYIVKKDGKTGSATLKNGELTVNFDYEDTWDVGSTIYGYKDGYTYILDDNDENILKVKGKYRQIHPEGNDKFIVYRSNNPDSYETESGLITSEGKILIPFSSGYLYKKGDYYFRYPISRSSFSIFDENGKLLSKYDINFPSEANMRNFNQLEKILKVIPIEDLHKLFEPLEWSQIIAYSKDPEKTIELTQAQDIVAKFDDETLKDCLKRAPGAKKVALLKIFKKYNNSPMLRKYYKKYNIDEIKVNAPTSLDFDTGKLYRCKGAINTETFLINDSLNLVDLGSYYTFIPYAMQELITLVPKDQVIKNISYPFLGSLSKEELNQLKNLYNSGDVIYNKPL